MIWLLTRCFKRLSFFTFIPLRNKATVRSRLRFRLLQHRIKFLRIMAHYIYMTSFKHRKYIVLHCRQRTAEPRPQVTYCRTFREIWTCGFWDVRADRQTSRLRTPNGGEVIKFNALTRKNWLTCIRNLQVNLRFPPFCCYEYKLVKKKAFKIKTGVDICTSSCREYTHL